MSYRVWTCALAVLGACNFVYGLEDTRLRNTSPRTLVFDNSASATDLVDFPVMIVPDVTFDFGDITEPTTNIKFVDPTTQAELPFDIERWDPEGESVFWVRVPKITARSTTDRIEMHFGADVLATRDLQVWSPEYDLVVHGAAGGAAPNVASAAYQGRGATPVGTTDGVIGDGIAMPNTVTFEGSTAMLDGWDQFTIELWLYADYPSFPALPTPQTQPIEIHVLDRGGSLNLGRLIQTQVPDVLRLQIDTHFVGDDLYSSATTQIQRWTYIVFTFDGSAQWIYRDGGIDGYDMFAIPTRLRSNDPMSSNLFRLGDQGANRILQGKVDELRVSHVARTDDWVYAQFLSMTKRFVTINELDP